MGRKDIYIGSALVKEGKRSQCSRRNSAHTIITEMTLFLIPPRFMLPTPLSIPPASRREERYLQLNTNNAALLLCLPYIAAEGKPPFYCILWLSPAPKPAHFPPRNISLSFEHWPLVKGKENGGAEGKKKRGGGLLRQNGVLPGSPIVAAMLQ